MSKRWPDKTVIGLTGNIATGKSVVRRMLEHLGAFGIDADSFAHRAMSPGAPAYQPVVDTFGKYILDPDGQINRTKLGNIVFSDPDALARLEAIVHPVIKQVVDLLIRRAKQKIIVIEAIKLFESSLAADCDSVWVVDAPEEVQLKRLMQTRNMTEAAARQRIAAQSPQADKIARATHVISNAGGYENTLTQVQRYFQELVAPQPEALAALPTDARVVIQRGTPKHAEVIADFIGKFENVSLSRRDILERFGQRAYMLAYASEKVIGLVGWQVENLITRVGEFYLAPGAPVESVVGSLIETVESNSSDLQSEIVLLFLRNDTPVAVKEALLAKGYEPYTLADFKVADWREAAEESAPPDSYLLVKKFREWSKDWSKF